MNDGRTFTLDELAAITGMPTRTVRYYIQHGLVDRPAGSGKGAYYTREHLEQLLAVRKWKDAGLSLERIRELVQGPAEPPAMPERPRQPGAVEVWSHIHVADGLEILVKPSRAGISPEALRRFAAAVMNAYSELTQEEQP